MKYKFFLVFFMLYTVEVVAQNGYLIKQYLAADGMKQKEILAQEIIIRKIAFDSLFEELQRGIKYPENVEKGFVEWYYNASNGVVLYSIIFIPYSYNPAQKYDVRFVLHGAVMNRDPKFASSFIDRNNAEYKSRSFITVYPSAYFLAPWWSEVQVSHIGYLLHKLKSQYNVDENRVFISGVSDGGTGTFFNVNVNASSWAGALSFIGNPGGLMYLHTKQTYASNFSDVPFFMVNAGQDHLFPSKIVKPYVQLFKNAGVDLHFFDIDTARHNLQWFPLIKDSVDLFYSRVSRNPLPDSIFWETEFEDRFNRCKWLVVNKIKKEMHPNFLPDINNVGNKENFIRGFRRDSVSGRIKAKFIKNKILVETNGVKEFTLLLSPFKFNFNDTLLIILNNNLVFEGKVDKKTSTLLKWHKIDNDKTMLFGAEIKVKTGKKATVSVQ